ncbi:hypothetical protein ES702_05117 [subsurface metagenome]
MSGELHLERAAIALAKFIDSNQCGWCRRKALEIHSQLASFRKITAEVEKFGRKIQRLNNTSPDDRINWTSANEISSDAPSASIPESRELLGFRTLLRTRPRFLDLLGGPR